MNLMPQASGCDEFIRRSVTQRGFNGIELVSSDTPTRLTLSLSMSSLHLRRLFQRALAAARLFVPGSCAVCRDDSPDILCDGCNAQFFASVGIRCEICALRLPDPHARWCSDCLQSPPAFDATIVGCDYAAPIDLLVKDLKFRAHLPLAAAFAQRLSCVVKAQMPSLPGLMLAVPLSEERLTERGFNQAAEIARCLSGDTGIPLHLHLCARIRNTRPQAGLPVSERRVNMRGAFTTLLGASARPLLRDQHVLVVDDVMTTGHTLNAMAACLKRQGAVRVTNAVFARTPYH